MCKYSLRGCVNWSVKVAKGMGFIEQIVAPGNSQTVPAWPSFSTSREKEFIDQPCGFKSTEFDFGLNMFSKLSF